MLTNDQHGIRKGRSCTDCIFSMSQLIEKHKKFNKPTFIALIDYIKAFHRVIRYKLWENIKAKGIPQHLLNAIKSLYQETNIVIEIDGHKSKKITVNQGVKQGCPLSPALFNFYIDDVICKWKERLFLVSEI